MDLKAPPWRPGLSRSWALGSATALSGFSPRLLSTSDNKCAAPAPPPTRRFPSSPDTDPLRVPRVNPLLTLLVHLVNWGDPGPGALTPSVPKVSLNALGLITRKDSRSDTQPTARRVVTQGRQREGIGRTHPPTERARVWPALPPRRSGFCLGSGCSLEDGIFGTWGGRFGAFPSSFAPGLLSWRHPLGPVWGDGASRGVRTPGNHGFAACLQP